MDNTIGIDRRPAVVCLQTMRGVSKDTLDVHRLTDGQHKQFDNGKVGHTQLLKWISLLLNPLIIVEGQTMGLAAHITGAWSKLWVQKPSHSWKWIQSRHADLLRPVGALAKTDRVDCEMLAKIGAALQLTPKPINAENLYDLRELLSTRRALIKDRTAAKARSATATHPLVKQQLAKRLRQIERDIAKIDAAMLQSSQQDQQMSERLDILFSSPGIGSITALMILVDMPEIGTLDNKQVASLAGLAPMSQSSGKWQGRLGYRVVVLIYDTPSLCQRWSRSVTMRIWKPNTNNSSPLVKRKR
jgi:transposase